MSKPCITITAAERQLQGMNVADRARTRRAAEMIVEAAGILSHTAPREVTASFRQAARLFTLAGDGRRAGEVMETVAQMTKVIRFHRRRHEI